METKLFKLASTICFLLFWGITGLSQIAQNSRNILYGEYTALVKETSNTSRIFYDRNGDLYPAYLIPDEDLAHAEGSLKAYFQSHPAEFRSIVHQYRIKQNTYSEALFQELQDSILFSSVRTINQKSRDFRQVHFLVHGFRKPFKRKGRGSTSIEDNGTLKRAIIGENSDAKEHFFVEVYWNSMYDCCFSKNIFKNRKLFKLFKNEAREHAVITGYQLRKVVARIKKDHVSLISHSLGARVLLACSFNAFEKNIDPKWKDIPTPGQKALNICMVAPAISKKPFKHYHRRTSFYNTKSRDNYRLFILYNEKDFVLRKKYKGLGPGPKRHGSTTLGCNHKNECFKLMDLFEKEYPNSQITLSHATSIDRCHLVSCYTGTDSFKTLIRFINW